MNEKLETKDQLKILKWACIIISSPIISEKNMGIQIWIWDNFDPYKIVRFWTLPHLINHLLLNMLYFGRMKRTLMVIESILMAIEICIQLKINIKKMPVSVWTIPIGQKRLQGYAVHVHAMQFMPYHIKIIKFPLFIMLKIFQI